MNIFQRYKNWKISREHKKYMKENKFQMYWGTAKVDESGNFSVDESCSFGPWIIGGEQIDITGNKEIS